MPTRYTFPKQERLKSRKAIATLFEQADHVFQYPFKILYLKKEEPSEAYPQVLVSVSKRNFKKAVERNRIKRLVREAYRLQKPAYLVLPTPLKDMALIYVGKQIEPYSKVEKGMKKGLKKLQKALEAEQEDWLEDAR